MAKPWAKYEVGFIDHDKFHALTGNAIALWLEGKNYCDEHHTDGLIPQARVRRFRFYGGKSMDLLTASCGVNPRTGAPYAPLWEAHPIGFKMHDYLEHNDCREEVLARLEDKADAAELRKIANKARQQKFREDRKAKLVTERNALRNASESVTSHPPTEAVPTPAATPAPEPEAFKKQKEQNTQPRARVVSLTPSGTSDDLGERAAWLLERYPQLYAEHRHGARVLIKPALDYHRAQDICRTWPENARLEQMIVILLTTDEDWIARTDRGFGVFCSKATWCDDRLKQWEAEHGIEAAV